MKSKSGERTLLASVVMSSPGPIIVGIGLLLGRSSTQLADFVRRTAELFAIIVSWLVFRMLHKSEKTEAARKLRLEQTANLFVGAAMSLSGAAMLFIAFFSPNTTRGNVIPGLVIAILGVTANTIFWLRYRRLNRVTPDVILAVQSKLYRAKALVDACVTVALACVAVAPNAPATRYVDLCGSTIVAVYLIINGAMTLQSSTIRRNSNDIP